MPSGAKKRKAAKKKKEQATNNPHGNDDPKSQDERDSDVKIEKGCEAKKDLESTHVSVQHVEHDKTSSSSSSSSSSDNLGSEVASYSTEAISATVSSEEAPKVAGIETLENVDINSAVETVAVDNLVIPVLPVAEEVDISSNNLVPDELESGLELKEEKILPKSNGVSGAETSNVAEKYQESEHHDNSVKQPLVASKPPPLQRTSLLSCCGLFEVFTGSGR